MPNLPIHRGKSEGKKIKTWVDKNQKNNGAGRKPAENIRIHGKTDTLFERTNAL